MTVEIIHADLFDVPPDLLTSADVQIVDPPFSEYVHANAVSARTEGRGTVKRDFGFDPLSPELRDYISLIAANVRRWSVVFSDLEGTHLWRQSMQVAGAEYVREVPWDSSISEPLPQRWIRWSQPQKSGDRVTQGAEAVLTFHRMSEPGVRGGARKPLRKRWNGSGGLMSFTERSLRGEHKHPTEKPLDLMLSIVSAFSDPHELVVDSCAGRGSTALACRLLERSCLGIEKLERWATVAKARVAGPLDNRDHARAQEWCDKWEAEAKTVPFPVHDYQRPTYKRAQRRLADIERVRAAL